MTLFQHGGIVKTNATQFCSAVDFKKKRGRGGGRFHGTWKHKLAEIRLDKNSTVIYMTMEATQASGYYMK